MSVAAIDIGTNSVRLLIAEAEGEGLRWIERRTVVTGLGAGVDATGRLAADPMGRTIGVLAAYGSALRSAGVARKLAVATSAVRDAANREEFLDLAEHALGTRPEVIDGAAEARLAFRGATSGISGGAPYLVIDPGGGSTEFVFGSDVAEFVESVDVGSVRLTERSLPDRPSGTGDLLAASASVEARFGHIRLPGEPATVIGAGETFTSLAAIAMDLPHHDRLVVHRSVLGLDVLGRLVSRLAGMTLEETAAIPSLDPARAPVLLAGAVVAEAAVRRSGRRSVVVSEAGVLDGVALRLLED